MAKNKSKKARRKPFFSKQPESVPVETNVESSADTNVQPSSSVDVSKTSTLEVRLDTEFNKVLEIIEKQSSETTAILQSNSENVEQLRGMLTSMVQLVEEQRQQVPELQTDLDSLKSQERQIIENLSSLEESQSDIFQKLKTLTGQLSPEIVESMVMDELRKQNALILKHAEELREELDSSSQYHAKHVAELRALIDTYEPGGLDFYKQKCDALSAENAILQQKIQTEIKDYHDDKIADLQDLIDIYKPGGSEVLKQQCEELQRQNSDLQQQRKELLSKLEVLEIREREQRLITVSPEELKAEQEKLAQKSNEIKERQVLQAEVERLAKSNRELSSELTHWQGIQRANLEDSDAKQDLIILQEQVERLDVQNSKLSEQKSKQSQKIDRQKRQIDELNRQFESLKDFQEQYADYQEDLEQTKQLLKTKSEEIRTLHKNKHSFEHAHSELSARVIEKETEILGLQEQIQTLKQEDEQRQSEWELKMRKAFEVERKKWFADTEASLKLKFELAHDLLLSETNELKAKVDTITAQLTDSQIKCRELQVSLEKHELTEQILEEVRAKVLEQSKHWEEHYENEYQRWIDTASQDYQDELADVDNQKSMLTEQQETWRESRDERAEEIARLEGTKGALLKEIELLEQKRLGLEEKIVPPEEAKAGLLKGFSEYDEFGARKAYSGTEKEWLSQVQSGIEDSGFVFHPRLLNAFHTALKISDYSSLVVLAGISGTGKSELPRLYADLGGLPFFEIAVQPSWDSTQDLFGFFNYTDGRYKAEPLSRLLYDMTSNEDSIYANHPVIWLLDEMNLARVEYYFADLLSKLETRRGVVNSNNPDEWLRAAVDLDMGPNLPITLKLPRQLLFVGTMNEDESTLALSDKVLDRSSLLQFPRPKDMKWHQQFNRRKASHRLTWETWTEWKNEPNDGSYTDKLNEMNTIMDQLGRPFGHRLFRNVQAYIANHPLEDASEVAFEDQFVMKIAPRLRGLETTQPGVRKHLQSLRDCIPESLHDAFEEALDQEFFQWSNPSSLFE